jgi:hypothetical protein
LARTFRTDCRRDRYLRFLHGDLWGGNILVAGDLVSGLIDPACYHGHTEVDLAMLGLFDQPDAAFYEAYGSLEPGHDGGQRSIVCGPRSSTCDCLAPATGRWLSGCYRKRVDQPPFRRRIQTFSKMMIKAAFALRPSWREQERQDLERELCLDFLL